MSSTIHGLSTKALKYLKRPAATVAVYLCYIARQNKDSVAWPSLAGLSRDTGWDKNTCMEARHKLVELGALELVKDYLHPKWRGLSAQELTRVRNISRIEFYKVTGSIEVEGVVYPILYTGASEINDIDEVGEGENPPMSEETRRRKKPDVGANRMELDSNGIELDTNSAANAAQPTAPKKERKRDVIFDAIAVHLFGITGDANGTGARIAKVAKRLKELEPSHDAAQLSSDVHSFAMWYARKYPTIDKPRDPEKVAEHWQAWRAGNQGGASDMAAFNDKEARRLKAIAEREARAKAISESDAIGQMLDEQLGAF